MPKDFEWSKEFNWEGLPPARDEEFEKAVNAWTKFFALIYGTILIACAVWITLWIIRSSDIADWNIAWWKCAILGYVILFCKALLTGIDRINRK
jgi:hypothetical protein